MQLHLVSLKMENLNTKWRVRALNELGSFILCCDLVRKLLCGNLCYLSHWQAIHEATIIPLAVLFQAGPGLNGYFPMLPVLHSEIQHSMPSWFTFLLCALAARLRHDAWLLRLKGHQWTLQKETLFLRIVLSGWDLGDVSLLLSQLNYVYVNLIDCDPLIFLSN